MPRPTEILQHKKLVFLFFKSDLEAELYAKTLRGKHIELKDSS